jgi:hypothetical protein
VTTDIDRLVAAARTAAIEAETAVLRQYGPRFLCVNQKREELLRPISALK